MEPGKCPGEFQHMVPSVGNLMVVVVDVVVVVVVVVVVLDNSSRGGPTHVGRARRGSGGGRVRGGGGSTHRLSLSPSRLRQGRRGRQGRGSNRVVPPASRLPAGGGGSSRGGRHGQDASKTRRKGSTSARYRPRPGRRAALRDRGALARRPCSCAALSGRGRKIRSILESFNGAPTRES